MNNKDTASEQAKRIMMSAADAIADAKAQLDATEAMYAGFGVSKDEFISQCGQNVTEEQLTQAEASLREMEESTFASSHAIVDHASQSMVPRSVKSVRRGAIKGRFV